MKYIYLLFIISFTYINLSAQDLLMQDGTFNQCSGNFYDSGGPNNDFQLGENLTITICPDGPDLETILEFSFFEMNSVHEMTIYDAADSSDPTTIIGVFSGTLANNPELNFVAATNPTGCLTINFDSAPFPFPPFTGWEAAISCRPPCQTITPELISIDPTCAVGGGTANDFVSINTPITFTAGAVTSSGVTDDLTYTWNFEGVIQNGQVVDQSFGNTGDVDISLTVTDSFGCFETIEFTITVGDNVILIDDTNFTLDQLINGVLISGTCSIVDNINSPLSAQASNAGFDSYGYFNKGCSNFPFDEGVVLASEGVSGIPTGLPSENPFGPGDPDLSALGGGNTNDATVIEFEFTPFVDQIQFNYLFASDEYNFPSLSFVCSFADTFAFILSGPGIPNTNDYDHDANPNTPDLTLDLGGLNIALVPGTNVPVSAVNVHTNDNCAAGSLGEFAFPQFFDNANVPPPYHKYTGQMRVLTAQADVIPGQVYNIKLAISDFSDSILNSAVFIEGGSFELGANVGEDLVLDDITAVCQGEVQTLEVFNGIAPTGFTFQWTKDGQPIAGETGPTLDVTETGEYCIELAAGTDCDSSDCVFVEYIPVFDQSQDVNEVLDINICQPFTGFPIFDLSLNNGAISTNISNEFFNDYPDFQTDNPGVDPYGVRYFETFADAANGTNPIPDPQNYSIDPLILPFTVYYSVEDTFGLGCFNPSISVGSFEINSAETPVGALIDLASCSNNAGEDFAFFDLLQNETNALDGEDPTEYEVTYYTSEQNAIDDVNPILTPDNFQNTTNPQTIWVKLDDLESEACFSLANFELAVDVIPEITSAPQDLSACGDFTLTQSFDLSQYDATSLGISNASQTDITFHNTLPDAEANINPIMDPTNYSPSNNLETIFIRAENINTTACFSTASFEIEIFDAEANQAQDIEVCAVTGNTGFTTFDLTQQNNDIFGPNQDSTTHSISYHTSDADAQAGASPIPNPDNYTNTSNPQTIWARVQNNDDPSCFEVSSFELSVIEEPVISQTPDLSQCGDFSLTQVFDLTQNDAAALGIANAADVQLTYYTSQADADAGTNFIPDPANYNPASTLETIFVRAENVNSSTCFTVDSFTVEIFDAEANQAQDIEVCAATGNSGFTTFDLTQQNNDIFGPNQDSTTHSISYHTSDTDAQGGTNPIPNPDTFTNTSNPQTIWARVQNNDDPSCFEVSSFELSVIEEPVITQTPDLSQCGDFSLTQVFDLTQNDAAALGIANAADVQLTYYTSQADADAGTNFIPDPANYNPSSTLETIFVRAENVNSSTCFTVDSFTVEIFDAEANQAQDIEVCTATGNTGFTNFNLLQQDNDIFGPDQDAITHSISYYTSLADAQDGTNPIPNPDTFTNTSNPQTIWTRVQNNDDPSCFAVGSFELSVTEEPEILNPPADLIECSDFTTTPVFDLSQYDAAALGIANAGETQITYHNNSADANTGNSPIADPANYQPVNEQEDIFIRAANVNDSTCFVTASFSVEFYDVEILPANNLESCDDGAGTATSSFDLTSNSALALGPNQNTTTHNISYHTTQADADTGSNPIASPGTYDNTSSPQTIWIRVENVNNTDCFAVGTFQLSVTDSAPINTDIDPLIACDDDNDGFFNNFDLNSVTAQINAGNPDVVVTYHLTPSDAQNGVGVLSSPYANVVENVQTLYFRAVDTNNGCEQFGDFELQVLDSPLLTPIEEPLIGCDDDNDGFLLFDLTQVEAEVLGSLDPANLVITYHTSLSNAQDAINAIPVPDNYQNSSSPQTIWIRVTDSGSPVGCFDIESFQIIVEPTPVIVDPEPLEVCDDEESGDLSDEIATFDLNDKIAEITQGNNELNVEFFESQMDLDNDNPIAPIDAYVNIANPQTLEVKVTSGTNGCSSFTTLTLVVNPVPSMAPVLEPLEVCDPDNDGFGEFDLQEAIIDILNNEPDVSITFHLTLADAELGVNPIDISSPYGTSNPGQQTIYVRAENTGPNGDDGTGCFDTRPLDLIVIPSPEIEELEDLSRCDDDSANGFASFDLTVNTPLALGSQDPAEHTVSYHESQADAEQGINPIAVPSNYTNITNPQIVYVRIENLVTGCIDLYSSTDDVNNTFTLTVEALPIVNTPGVLEVCDDDDNPNPFPQTTFNLTIKEPEIIGQSAVPANLQFTYYASQADFDNDIAIADPTSYVNTSQPQSIFVSVVDTATENNCFDSTVMTISVLPLPSPSETDPDVLRLQGCDDDNDGVGNQPFDLTESGVLIAGSENVDLSYYLSEEGANTQDAADLVADPTAYVNDPALNLVDENGVPTNVQVIYVRVDNGVAGNFCYVIVPIELIVDRAPVLNPNGDPFAYTLCEDDAANPGVAMLFSLADITNNLWDFTNGSSDVIIPLLDPNVSPAQNIDDFTVTYYFTEQDAENGVNGISPGTTVSDGDILFIRVINQETFCSNTGAIGQVQIVIEPRPAIAADDPDDIIICAEDISSPSVGTVDLTTQNDTINPGAPANTTVMYYAGMMNYNNAEPITDPTNFTTTQSPQTIIAEVINTDTLCESSSFVTFEVIVNPLPVVDISGFDGAVVCFDGAGALISNEVSPPTIDTGLSEDIYDFAWTLDGVPLPDTTSSIQAIAPGIYIVTATDSQTSCEASSSAEVIESNPPVFEVTVLTPSFSGSHVVEVSDIIGSGDFEFQLDDGPWISLAPGQTTLVFSNITPGMHVIRGRDSGGCGIITVDFNLIDYPPFFTPNQDGFNDTWNITSLSGQTNAKIYIFDRYGKLLKQISPQGQGWDGTYNGQNMPAQDYWFRVEFEEPTTSSQSTFKAHFTLKR